MATSTPTSTPEEMMVEAPCMEEEFAVPDPPPAKSSYTPRMLFHTLQGYPSPDVHDEPDEDMLEMDEGDTDPPQETSAALSGFWREA
jgi:hypothetical protein